MRRPTKRLTLLLTLSLSELCRSASEVKEVVPEDLYEYELADEEVKLPAWLRDLNLPLEMLPYVVASDEQLRQKCRSDAACPFKATIEQGRCMGFEQGCDYESTLSYTSLVDCYRRSPWPNARTWDDQKKLFWTQGDYGVVKAARSTMTDICVSKPSDTEGSYLACSEHLRHCVGNNIFFNFKSLNAPRSTRYREDVIHEGEVGGRCSLELRKEILSSRADHKSYLQSWAHELIHFESYKDFNVDKQHCDVIFERPTVVIKLDAAVNMYHHFCDFVNLFASQHVNGSFSDDVDIVWWDTHPNGFNDPMFGGTWRAFSRHKPVELIHLDGKRVCFRQALFPLLARQRLGLFFNLPLVDGCRGSLLFRWFSKFVLHRLNVPQPGPQLDKIRIMLLSRETSFRNIMNEKELIAAMEAVPEFEVKRVVYKAYRPPFVEQLGITHASDIFIGMHGSGLTHLLFLPDWAAVFEVYNCDDRGCYYDLARLRGLEYRTWEEEKADKRTQHGPGQHPRHGTPHKKFTNYSFDVDEFMRIVHEMAAHVREHPAFKRARQVKARRSRRAANKPKRDLDYEEEESDEDHDEL